MNSEDAQKEIRAARLKELLFVTGCTAARLAAILGVSTSAVSQWMGGRTVPDRVAYTAMADRWYISLDSLVGRVGTSSLEPDPQLRRAQSLVRDGVVELQNAPATATERLILVYQMLMRCLPGLTVEAWADYLKCDPDRWNAIETGFREAADSRFTGAAFLLGWTEEAPAWEDWFRTGDAGLLRGPSETAIKRALATLNARGGGLADVLKAIETRTNK